MNENTDPSPYDPEPMRRAKEVAARRRKPVGFGNWLAAKSKERRREDARREREREAATDALVARSDANALDALKRALDR